MSNLDGGVTREGGSVCLEDGPQERMHVACHYHVYMIEQFEIISSLLLRTHIMGITNRQNTALPSQTYLLPIQMSFQPTLAHLHRSLNFHFFLTQAALPVRKVALLLSFLLLHASFALCESFLAALALLALLC